MAFPTTGIIDTVTTTEDPVTTKWTTPLDVFSGNYYTDGSKMGGREGGAWYDLSTFGPDSEVWGTVTAVPASDGRPIRMYTNYTNPPDNNSGTFYRVSWVKISGSWYVSIHRCNAGSFTNILGSDYGPITALAAGYGVGMSCIGNVVTAYVRYGASGTSWTTITSADDSAAGSKITVAGYIAVHSDDATVFWDDIGGGTAGTGIQSIAVLSGVGW